MAAGALAEDLGDVTVQASRVEVAQVGRTSSGLPIVELTVSHVVRYADLDLATSAGMAELQDRLERAARHGCSEISFANPLAQPGDSLCARQAAEEAMVRVRAMVAAN